MSDRNIWVSWDKFGARVNTHGDKRYTPTDAREYVTADRIEQLAAINEELEASLAQALVHLEWFISEDETNRGDEPMPERGNRTWNEINAYWLKHLDSAIAFVAEVKGDKT